MTPDPFATALAATTRALQATTALARVSARLRAARARIAALTDALDLTRAHLAHALADRDDLVAQLERAEADAAEVLSLRGQRDELRRTRDLLGAMLGSLCARATGGDPHPRDLVGASREADAAIGELRRVDLPLGRGHQPPIASAGPFTASTAATRVAVRSATARCRSSATRATRGSGAGRRARTSRRRSRPSRRATPSVNRHLPARLRGRGCPVVARRPSRPQRPPGQVVLQHDWRWAPQPRRLPWGFLATTGPHEESYVAGNGTLDGSAYECERCGCVRMFAYLEVTDRQGEVRRASVALHGFDWQSLAPMRAPSCEVFDRPVHAEAIDVVEELEQLDQGAAA